MWVVNALAESGASYTYLVDAPMEADPESVACCAYARHGQLKVKGLVPEYLTGLHGAYWQEVTQWVKD